MTQKRTYGKKAIPLFISIGIALLLVSAVTAVPQQSASAVVEKIEKNEQINMLIETINTEELNQQSMCIMATFILNLAQSLLEKVKENPQEMELTEEMIYDAIPEDLTNSDSTQIIEQTEEAIEELQKTVDSLSTSSDDAMVQTLDITFLQELISLLLSFLQDNVLNGNGNIGSNSNGGIFSTIVNILGVIVSIITFLLKGIMQGVSLLLSGVLKIITALISIVLLIILAMQTSLTVGAFFLIFLGFVSKIGLRVFSILGAPIFALLAAQFTISTGKLLGGLSMGLLALLALVVFFAIPIIIGLAVFYLSGGISEDDDDEGNFTFNYDGDGLIYMLISVFLNMLNQ